ncbi:MAG: hypothetical protein RL226_114 [Bacteroidota bacterium]|jgi:hypothetical protein
MKTALLLFSAIALMSACQSGPAFSDKVNETSYGNIQLGMNYEQVVFEMGGLDGQKKLEDPATGYAAYDWPNGDMATTTYSISVAFSNDQVVGKAGTSYDEKGQVIKQDRYPN